MTKHLKTEMVGFGQSAPTEARPSARKPRARKSGKEREKDTSLPKRHRGDRSHMALIESIMAEARGSSAGRTRNDSGQKPNADLPRQTKAGTRKGASIDDSAIGAALEGPALGSTPRKGASQRSVIPHTESMEGYVDFLADMTVGAAFDSKPRPPRPTGRGRSSPPAGSPRLRRYRSDPLPCLASWSRTSVPLQSRAASQ